MRTPACPLRFLQKIKFDRGGLVRRSVKETNMATEHMDAEEWWSAKKKVMLEYIKGNPLCLGTSQETMSFVKTLLQRGDKAASRSAADCLSVRAKCWKYIVNEVRHIPGIYPECTSLEDIPGEAAAAELQGLAHAVSQGEGRAVEDLESSSAHELRLEVLRLDGELRLARESAAAAEAARVEEARVASEEAENLRAQVENLRQELSAAVEGAAAAAAEAAAAATAAAAAAAVPSSPVRGAGIRAVKALSADDAGVGKKRISEMSMMERQEHWLRQRKEKRELKERTKREAEDAEIAKANAKKAEEKRRRASKWDHVRSRISEIAKQEKPDAKANTSAKQKSKPKPKPPIRRKRASKVKARPSSLLSSCQDMLQKNHSVKMTADEVGEHAPPLAPQMASLTPTPTPTDARKAAIAAAAATPAAAEVAATTTVTNNPEEKPEKETAKADFQFDKVGTTKEKGRFTIRDSSDFAIDSMYRRRDLRARKKASPFLWGGLNQEVRKRPLPSSLI